jgi:hypothetical protein
MAPIPEECNKRNPSERDFGNRRRGLLEHAQDGKQFGQQLNLVQDDKPSHLGERELRLSQAGQGVRILEVEARDRLRTGGGELPRECCLANLARAEDRHDRELVKTPPQAIKTRSTKDHASVVLEIVAIVGKIQ